MNKFQPPKHGVWTVEDGTVKHYCHGQLHRVDGPAVEYIDGSYEWLSCGRPHRVDGPAIRTQDTVLYLVHGYLHCTHGPAKICDDGRRFWYLWGNSITERQHTAYITKAALVLQRFARKIKLRRFVRLCRTPPTNGQLMSMHEMFVRWDRCNLDRSMAKIVDDHTAVRGGYEAENIIMNTSICNDQASPSSSSSP